MQPGCTTQARALQAERYGLVHVTRQRAPGAVVHDSNHGFQGRFGEGFDLGEGGEAGSLGGFRGLFLQEHVRTRTTAGTRGSQHRLYWGGLRNPNHAVARSSALRETGLCARGILEQVTRDRVFYLEVLRVVASLGTPDCKGFSSARVTRVRAHRLLRWFPHQEGLRREATGSVRLHPLGDFALVERMRKTRTSLFRSGYGTVALRELASRSSRQTAFSHQRQDRLRPQGLELRGPPQLRLFLHGLLKDRGGRNHADRAQRIHRDVHREEAGHGKMAQGSREQGGLAPHDAGRWDDQGTSHHRPQAPGRQRRRRIARACCLAAPLRPHQQRPLFDGLRQRNDGGSTRRKYRLRLVG